MLRDGLLKCSLRALVVRELVVAGAWEFVSSAHHLVQLPGSQRALSNVALLFCCLFFFLKFKAKTVGSCLQRQTWALFSLFLSLHVG